jgi:putative ABC transport system permease protein
MLGLSGSVSLVDVGALCNNCPVEVISNQIMYTVPGVKATPVMQAVETRMKAVEQTASFSLLLAAIILVVGCAGVMNTMLASVHERLKEIGILMSLGADNRHLYKMFFWESVVLGLVGGLIGILVGVLSSILFGSVFINVQINIAEVPLYVVPLAIALSVLSCLVASIYPTWRASKVDPVKALKAV